MSDCSDPHVAASCLSFRPRQTDLLKKSPGELGRQRNIGAETRTKVAQKQYLGCGMLATITRVSYGTYEGQNACLVVFNFSFRWNRDRYRLKRGEIQITFDRYPKTLTPRGEDDSEPVMRNLSPRKVYGIPNSNGQKWFLNVEQLCWVSPTPAVRATETKAFVDEHRLEITGMAWSDTRRREVHKGCWVIKEVGSLKYGILDEMNLAMIVEHKGSLQAEVKITVDTPLLGNLFGFPWPADDPILFVHNEPTSVIGAPPRVSQFEALSDADWNSLISGHEVTSLGQADTTPNSDRVNQAFSKTALAVTQTTSSKTYRAQWVPGQNERLGVKDFLESVLMLQDGKCDIQVRSLASSPDLPNAKMVTFASSSLGPMLGAGTRWARQLPHTGEESSTTRKEYVVIDTTFLGFTSLGGDAEDYDFDIIALSGLGAHAFGSFKERSGDHMWLRDDVAFDFPRARVVIYGYETTLAGSQSFQDLDALAITFRTALKTIRPDTVDRRPNDKPILFIAHSLGGIVLKQALIQMADGDRRDQAYAKATRGILFFGVPSQGMDIGALRAKVKGQPNEFLLSNLRAGSDVLRKQTWDFRTKFPHETCRIISFYETELSPTAKQASHSYLETPHGWAMTGEPAILVSQASATGGSRSWEGELNYMQPIKRTHSDMVKFYPRDPCYALVKHTMMDLIETFSPSGPVPAAPN